MPGDAPDLVSIEQSLGRDKLYELHRWSSIPYPTADLDVAIEVVRVIRRLEEPEPSLLGLVEHLRRPEDPLEFPRRIATAMVFALVELDDQRIRLTELGQRISNRPESAAAKVDAFMGIPLYAALFTRYNGAVLPQVEDMESEFVRRGVADELKSDARVAFHRSAMIAGFFSIGAHRLIMPRLSSNAAPRPAGSPLARPRLTLSNASRPRPEPVATGPHPLIGGLMATLPEPGSPWPLEARRKWLQSAALNFDLVYEDAGPTPGSIVVSVQR